MNVPKPRISPISTPVIMWTDNEHQHLIELKTQSEPAVKTVPAIKSKKCNKYLPGHHVHYIQLKLGIGRPIQPVTLISVAGNAIQVEVNGISKTWYHHRPEQFEQLLAAYGGPVPGWEHEQHLFECQGHIFCMAMDQVPFTPC